MNKLIGQVIPEETVDTILNALEIKTISHEGDIRDLRVPTYRVDVQRPCDVVEDILRIYGYNNIDMPSALHASLSFKTETDTADDLRRKIAQQLTAAGFREILNNSLTAERYYTELSTYPANRCVKLLNALSQDLNVMRQTLLFGGLESLSHNINRRSKDLAFYEFGNVYELKPGTEISNEKPLTPFNESAHIALWMSGNSRTGNWSRQSEEVTFYDLKAHVLNIFERLGIDEKSLSINPLDKNDIYGASLKITSRSGKDIGTIGLVNKAILSSFDIKQDVAFAEFDWNALCGLAMKSKTTFAELPKTQAVKRDLALLIDTNITFAQIADIVRQSERRILRDIILFDVYEGNKLPVGKKSYAISITLQDDEKTLQDKYIDQVMNKIITNLQKQLGAQLR